VAGGARRFAARDDGDAGVIRWHVPLPEGGAVRVLGPVDHDPFLDDELRAGCASGRCGHCRWTVQPRSYRGGLRPSSVGQRQSARGMTHGVALFDRPLAV
jgi:hypothetical protein